MSTLNKSSGTSKEIWLIASEDWTDLCKVIHREALLNIALASFTAKFKHARLIRLLKIGCQGEDLDKTGVLWLNRYINQRDPTPDISIDSHEEKDLRVLHLAWQTLRYGSEIDNLYRLSRENDIIPLPFTSEWYPPNLKAFPQAPPAILYVSGRAYREAICSRYQLTVVGSRKATSYGYQFLRSQMGQLAAEGFNIISGLARGIDGAAHKEIIHAGGKTLAVVGHGLDMCYPPEHHRLMQDIKEHGAILSEFLPGTQLKRTSFPARNRILAGIGQATFVVEADTRSGALITANQAVEGGRDVFALPGSVDAPVSRGCIDLICEGALPIRHSGDLISGLGQYSWTPYGLRFSRQSEGNGDRAEAGFAKETNGISDNIDGMGRKIILELKRRAYSVDQLAEALNEPLIPVMLALTTLEMRGCVNQVQGLYALTSEGYAVI